MPLVCTFVNFWVSKIVFKASHGFLLLPVGLVYGYLNYTTTKAQGKPVYHFLTWEDETSFLIYGGLTLACLCSYFIMACISQAIKQPDRWGSQPGHAKTQ
uniref:Uncharacterized protein n=1 Tax=Favella ehrenbergii TaxID=182087 RepID=A0A7S3HX03_9SPIT|mmetsp:Transcript_15173/g.19214  ORF Transcript_15173/g.19214 Transcript_15173/m.19214 type:complete len:100 (+) Transcript_15173:429-728(+)